MLGVVVLVLEEAGRREESIHSPGRFERGGADEGMSAMQRIANDLNFEQTDERRESEGVIYNDLSREKIFSQASLTCEVTYPRSHNSPSIDVLLHTLPSQSQGN